jgi:hypothetical protein
LVLIEEVFEVVIKIALKTVGKLVLYVFEELNSKFIILEALIIITSIYLYYPKLLYSVIISLIIILSLGVKRENSIIDFISELVGLKGYVYNRYKDLVKEI